MPRRLSELPFHYGWVIVFAGVLTLFSCLGLARFAYGMLLPAMQAGLGLAYDQMGFISTGNFAGYLAAVAAAPTLIRRFRPRTTIVGGLLLIALCMFGIARSHGFGAVLVLYALTGIGSGLANIPAMVLVSHWFRPERRGLAAGLMVTGNGSAIIFAGLFLPTLGDGAVQAGWRSGWLLLGLISLVIALVGALLLRNDPREAGLEPLGRTQPRRPEPSDRPGTPGGGRLLAQLGLLYFAFGATYMVYGTFIVTTMVVEFGFAEARAGLFWAVVGFFGLFSGVGFGLLSDRIGRRRGLAAVFLVQTAAYLLAAAGSGGAALLLSVVLYGLAAFAVPTIMAAAVGDYLGASRAARAFSAVTLFFAVGQTVGPGAAGLLADATGTFTSAYLAAAVLTGLAILFAAALPRPPAAE